MSMSDRDGEDASASASRSHSDVDLTVPEISTSTTDLGAAAAGAAGTSTRPSNARSTWRIRCLQLPAAFRTNPRRKVAAGIFLFAAVVAVGLAVGLTQRNNDDPTIEVRRHTLSTPGVQMDVLTWQEGDQTMIMQEGDSVVNGITVESVIGVPIASVLGPGCQRVLNNAPRIHVLLASACFGLRSSCEKLQVEIALPGQANANVMVPRCLPTVKGDKNGAATGVLAELVSTGAITERASTMRARFQSVFEKGGVYVAQGGIVSSYDQQLQALRTTPDSEQPVAEEVPSAVFDWSPEPAGVSPADGSNDAEAAVPLAPTDAVGDLQKAAAAAAEYALTGMQNGVCRPDDKPVYQQAEVTRDVKHDWYGDIEFRIYDARVYMNAQLSASLSAVKSSGSNEAAVDVGVAFLSLPLTPRTAISATFKVFARHTMCIGLLFGKWCYVDNSVSSTVTLSAQPTATLKLGVRIDSDGLSLTLRDNVVDLQLNSCSALNRWTAQGGGIPLIVGDSFGPLTGLGALVNFISRATLTSFTAFLNVCRTVESFARDAVRDTALSLLRNPIAKFPANLRSSAGVIVLAGWQALPFQFKTTLSLPVSERCYDCVKTPRACQRNQAAGLRLCYRDVEASSQSRGALATCSRSSGGGDASLWTLPVIDDTDGRDGGRSMEFGVDQLGDPVAGKEYRLCFRETSGGSECQGPRLTCTPWGVSSGWTEPFRDDTDNRSGSCTYQWAIEERAKTGAKPQKCRVCFRETEGSSQCQGNRNSCSSWSNATPASWAFTEPFRDDTDNRGGGCKYSWGLNCVDA